ncbi:MAG: MotA/TolQ/ExbB proton channel family protein [Chthoniobacterales bacterium]
MKTKTLLLCAATAIALLFGTAVLRAQEATPAPTAQKPAIQTKSLWQQIQEGGWIMFPIGAVSILAVYLICDGAVRTSRNKVMPPEQVEAVKNFFRPGDYVGAYNYCRENPSPFTNVCRVAVSMIGDGKDAVEEGIFSELSKEDSKMQTQISYLSVIGVCAPMIGLVGTVTGMIKAFATLGAAGIGDPSSLAAAIGEVLVATASGLFIAIPAFAAYYYLRNRAVKVLHDIEDTMVFLFRKLPFELAAGVHIGDEELVAGVPNWVETNGPTDEPATA